ncbi:unnamed protein product [Urochloa decumbens]|uniref:F-box domain-containing protein n=1 Tax=Urochloa decumbens TaxID=240449 RepID=A0ABC9B0C4_9POAL
MGSVLSWKWNKPAELPAPSSLANDGTLLPTDLLYEILLHLPASELCRLRLVCRSWRSLTSDPGFAKAHASRHPLVVCIHGDEDSRACELRIVELSGKFNRARPGPPIFVSSQSGQTVVIYGVAYFLPLSRYYIDYNPTNVKPDTIALFDMTTEEWRNETLQGPVNNHATEDVDKKLLYDVYHYNLELAILDSCLVMVQHGFRDCSIHLWFLEDVDKGLWAKRYSTQYAPSHLHNNMFLPPYPLVLLEDGKILMWVARKDILRVYDPTRRTWADLTELEHCLGISMYTGNLLPSD